MTEVLVPPQGPQDSVEVVHAEFLAIEGVEHHRYAELFDRYTSSPFGIFHAEQPLRYSNRYAYDGETMLADLGDNIHPIRHMQFTEAEIFRPLAATQNSSSQPGVERFTDADIATGRLAALLHDIGECEHPDIIAVCGASVGDVNYWEKTSDHDNQEAIIRAFLYETLYGDLPPELHAQVEAIIAHPENSLMGQAFKATEYIGYFLVDLSAGNTAIEIRDALSSEADELRFAQLSKMAINETAVWHERVAEFGQRFPYAAQVAEQTLPEVERILNALT